jgi:energy-converting hydrogenase Eha subunit C
MMYKRGPRKLKTVAKSVIRFSLAMVVMDIAYFIPVEVVLAHMVEGDETEGYVEAEEAVVLIEAVATILLVTCPLLKIQNTCQKRGSFQNKDRT